MAKTIRAKRADQRLITMAVFASLMFAGVATASPKRGAEKEEPFTPRPSMTDAQFKQLDQAALERSKKNRSIAAADDHRAALSTFRKALFAVTTPQALDALLNQIDTGFDAQPDEVKHIAAQLLLLKAYKSIVYRLTDYVNEKNSRITHSALLTFVRQLATMTRTYLPNDLKPIQPGEGQDPTDKSPNLAYLDAALHYVLQPVDRGVVTIKDSHGFRKYLKTELKPELERALDRLEALWIKRDGANIQILDKHLLWDNQIAFGSASFADGIFRFQRVDQAEAAAVISSLHGALSALDGLLAYHFEDLLPVCEATSKIYGFDGVVSSFFSGTEIEGAPARKRFEILKQFPNFMTLRKDNGPQFMQEAYNQLVDSVNYAKIAWDEVKTRPADELSILNSAYFTPMNRQIQLSMDKLREMVSGPTTVTSAVTGESISVNLPRFFTAPRDLRDFWPTGFESGDKQISLTTPDGGAFKIRNFFEGRANRWNAEAYAPIFGTADVPSAARILAGAWGGALAGGPLALAVQ